MKKFVAKILMIVENPFPGDTRVKNEAYCLKKAGYSVTVLALRRAGQPARDEINGIPVYRIPILKVFRKINDNGASWFKRLFQKIQSMVGYAAEYLYFTIAAFCISFYILLKQGFDAVHIHNPPDTLFMVGLFYRLIGKKYVYDHHDLSPELYLSRFGIAQKNLIYRGLILVEKLCLKCANLVIATNESYKRIECERGNISPEKVYIVRNGPDVNHIKPHPPDARLKQMNRTILGYVGEINPQDGLDYLLRSLHFLIYRMKRTDVYCVIIGSGDALPDLKKLSAELKIEEYVHFTGYVPDKEMLTCLSAADICLDPDPSSPLNDVSTWIKIMEYMALAKPIVAFDLAETRYSAREAAVYIPPNNEAKFARAIAQLADDPGMRKKMGEYGRRRVYNELAWHHVSKNLIFAYQHLSGDSSATTAEQSESRAGRAGRPVKPATGDSRPAVER